MTPLTQQQWVRRRFSAAARSYARASDVQAAVARDLLKDIQLRRGMRALDVGAGDGLLADALSRAGVRVTALDAAWGMVRQGVSFFRRTKWVQADAGVLPFKAASFDLVASSSAYQWVDDLEGSFREARRVLKPGGRFMVAMFGYRTLHEFFESLAYAARAVGRKAPDLRRLPTMGEVAAALKAAGWKEPRIRIEERRVEFEDVLAILAWLKAVGANGASPRFFWGKALLGAMKKEYMSRCGHKGRVHAWFEVIWIEAGI